MSGGGFICEVWLWDWDLCFGAPLGTEGWTLLRRAGLASISGFAIYECSISISSILLLSSHLSKAQMWSQVQILPVHILNAADPQCCWIWCRHVFICSPCLNGDLLPNDRLTLISLLTYCGNLHNEESLRFNRWRNGGSGRLSNLPQSLSSEVNGRAWIRTHVAWLWVLAS